MQQATNQAVIAAGTDQAKISADTTKYALGQQVQLAKVTTPQPSLVESIFKPCFITTAFVDILGMPDDCEELQILREFRDGAMVAVPGGKKALEQYYVVGPRIVAALMQRDEEHRKLIASTYWQHAIKPACMLIQAGYDRAAITVYERMVVELTPSAQTQFVASDA
jgi:hypothetical protein